MKRLVAFSLLATFSSSVFAQDSGVGVFKNFLQPESQTEIIRKVTDFSKFKGMSAVTLKDSEFRPLGTVEQYGMKTSKAQYLYKGIPVVGGVALVHQLKDGTESVSSDVPSLHLDVTPGFGATQAMTLAKSFTKIESFTKTELKILPEARRTQGRLVYVVDFATTKSSPGSQVYLDAKSGALVGNISKLEHIAPTYVFSAAKKGFVVKPIEEVEETNRFFTLIQKKVLKSCEIVDISDDSKSEISADDCKDLLQGVGTYGDKACQLVSAQGEPMGFDLRKCTLAVAKGLVMPGTTDEPALRAKTNVDKVLQYFLDRFQRDSFDGKGSPAVSITSVGYNFSNAAWLGHGNDFMMYGAGDKDIEDFTKLVDVAGHEMTHGVVEHTAGLLGMGESGALNEAIADFFGKMIAQDGHWLIGKGLFKANPEAAIRDLKTPASLKTDYVNAQGESVMITYPDNMSNKIPVFGACDEENDRCQVHGNSTIPSHALYLLHEAIGKEKTETMLYLSLTHLLNESSEFADFSVALQKACSDLKYDETVCQTVTSTLNGMGL